MSLNVPHGYDPYEAEYRGVGWKFICTSTSLVKDHTTIERWRSRTKVTKRYVPERDVDTVERVGRTTLRIFGDFELAGSLMGVGYYRLSTVYL